MNTLYILGDGDKIRERVESRLLSGDLESLAKLSAALTQTISSLAEDAVAAMNARVVMAGGDDLLFVVDQSRYNSSVLEDLGKRYREQTGSSISFGVGRKIEEAYINLRRAKARGGGIVE